MRPEAVVTTRPLDVRMKRILRSTGNLGPDDRLPNGQSFDNFFESDDNGGGSIDIDRLRGVVGPEVAERLTQSYLAGNEWQAPPWSGKTAEAKEKAVGEFRKNPVSRGTGRYSNNNGNGIKR